MREEPPQHGSAQGRTSRHTSASETRHHGPHETRHTSPSETRHHGVPETQQTSASGPGSRTDGRAHGLLAGGDGDPKRHTNVESTRHTNVESTRHTPVESTRHTNVESTRHTPADVAPSSPDDALWLRWAAMRSRVVGKLVRAGWSEADAEDLFGQGLVRAWERRGTLADAAGAEAWFWTLMRRLALDTGRADSRRRKRFAADTELENLPAEEGEEDPCACSLRLLETLAEETRTLVEAVDLQDEAVYEAASRMGLSANAASARLFRARRALRGRLAEQCGTTSVAACQDCGCPADEEAR